MSITGIQLRCGPEGTTGMSVTLGATKAAGALDKIGGTVGVYFEGGDSGKTVTFIYRAKKVLLPKDANAISQGAKVYYDATAGKITATATSNTLCGRAIQAAAAGDATVLIDFNGAVEA